MDALFWTNAWKEGRTGFHQGRYNDKLLTHFPRLGAKAGQKVLVPLCGKSKDMIWLHEQGLQVRGIELFEDAVKAFFPENELPPPTITKDRTYTNYSHGTITISCGDFFRFAEPENYDVVYDRAALVALPPEMREGYVNVVHRSLKKNGNCLLLTYEYKETELEGPPFSISPEEIGRLYAKNFSIELLESERPRTEGTRLETVGSLRQNVYLLTSR